MAVDIAVKLADGREQFSPGELLRCSVRIDPYGEEMERAEVSVLWMTEGKGDTDMAVVMLRELDPHAGPDYFVETPLPLLPLTYHGRLLKIHWLIRVRVSVHGARDTVFDYPFTVAARAAVSH